MNILLVTGKMASGGAETHVYELARVLVRLGHDVTLVSAGGRLSDKLSEAGIKSITIPLDSKKFFLTGGNVKRLRKIIMEGSFDVVHAHTRISALAVHRALRDENCLFVTTVHARFKNNVLLDRVSRWGNAAIAVSYDLKQYLISYSRNILSENICVIPNGIDTERFCPNKNKEHKSRIVFASRLDMDCSLAAYILIALMEDLEKRFKNIELMICGGGSEYKRLKIMAEQVNLKLGRNAVKLMGQVDDMSEALKGADVFVGVSRAALEAMSCGIPTVLAGNEGFIGLIGNENVALAEKSNFCCRGCDKIIAQRLFDDIAFVLSSEDEWRERKGAYLRSYVRERHSCDMMARKTVEFYKRHRKKLKDGKNGVVLCGYYGYDNMGDDALLLSAIKRAEREFPCQSISALTARGRSDSVKFGIRCVRRSSPIEAFREVKNAAAVIFGGGTLLQSSTSRRSLLYYIFVLRLAQHLGKRTELWGNGIGRIEGNCFREIAGNALARCDYIGLRDEESISEVKRLINTEGEGLPTIALEADLALSMESDIEGEIEEWAKFLEIDLSEPFAVIALRGTEQAEYIRLAEKHVCKLMLKGIMPVFVCMFPKEDIRLCRQSHKRFGGVFVSHLSIGEVKWLMRRARIVVGMRYHALVFARSVGADFVGIGSEPKIKRFCSSHGGVFLQP